MNTNGKTAQEIAEHLNAKKDGRTFAAAIAWYRSSSMGRPAEANAVVMDGCRPICHLGIDGAWYQSPGYWIACNGESPVVEVL